MTKEEREREHKRLKRQRYRANKRKREQEAKDSAAQQENTQVETPVKQEEASTSQEKGAAPAWLQGVAPEIPVSPEEPQPKKEEDDENVKFIISADSLEEKTPVKDKEENHLPPEGDIPLQEKEGE